MIKQVDGQWRITRAALAIIQDEAQPHEVLPPVGATGNAAPPLADDPEIEAAVAAAEARGPHDRPDASPKRGRDNSKQARVIALLRRPEGATIAQICEATGWQPHTVRGTLAGALKKKRGLRIVSEKIEGPAGTPGAAQRVYRIADGAPASAALDVDHNAD